MCAVKLKDWRLAVRHCNSAIEMQPDYAKVWLRRAHARLQLKIYDDAMKDATKAGQLACKEGEDKLVLECDGMVDKIKGEQQAALEKKRLLQEEKRLAAARDQELTAEAREAGAGTFQNDEDAEAKTALQASGVALPVAQSGGSVTFNGSQEKDYTSWFKKELQKVLLEGEVWIHEKSGGVLKPLEVADEAFGDSFACIKTNPRTGERALFYDISVTVIWRALVRRPPIEGSSLKEDGVIELSNISHWTQRQEWNTDCKRGRPKKESKPLVSPAGVPMNCTRLRDDDDDEDTWEYQIKKRMAERYAPQLIPKLLTAMEKVVEMLKQK